MLKKLQPCYQRVRTIVQKLKRMKACSRWLKEFDEAIQNKNNDILNKLAQNPMLPKIVTRRAQCQLKVDLSNHSQQKVDAKYGKWIKGVRDKIAENRIHPCFVCKNLQYKNNVNKLL